jgi:predicted Holliday junction resolvase-like endonuclease
VIGGMLVGLTGLVLGAVVGHILLRRWVAGRATKMLQRWRIAHAADLQQASTLRSRAVLRGHVTEQLAPLFDDFPYELADARFLGKPIDFIVFDGLAEVLEGLRDRLRQIIFVEIKTGRASLNTIERRIKECVESGQVHCWRLDRAERSWS